MPITPEQQALAFAGIARHSPDVMLKTRTLEEALRDPFVARLVGLHAWLLSRGVDPYASRNPAAPHRRPAVLAPEPPHPALADSLRHPTATRDHKRAAAGDFDDA